MTMTETRLLCIHTPGNAQGFYRHSSEPATDDRIDGPVDFARLQAAANDYGGVELWPRPTPLRLGRNFESLIAAHRRCWQHPRTLAERSIVGRRSGLGRCVSSTGPDGHRRRGPRPHADPLEVQIGPAGRYYQAIRFRTRSSMRDEARHPLSDVSP